MRSCKCGRSACWELTGFGDHMNTLEAMRKGEIPLPEWVKDLHGGLEECKTTKTPHFQGCIITAQMRCKKIREWLPGIHHEPAISKDALIKYSLKSETAIGEKSSISNYSYQTLGDLVEELVIFRYNYMVKTPPTEIDPKGEYLGVCRYYMSQDSKRAKAKASVLADPKTYRTYAMFAVTFYELYLTHLRELEYANDDVASVVSNEENSD